MQLHKFRVPNGLCLIAAWIVPFAASGQSLAQPTDRTVWTTGTEFQRRLVQPVNVLWSGTPLWGAVESLSRAQQVAILIDRRIDPSQKLDLKLRNVPMDAALQAIADRCGLGEVRLGAVVYLGPPSVAGRLKSAAAAFGQAVRRLPSATQRKFFKSKAMVWDDLATPRDLLAELGQQNGLEIGGLEQVPHDLWAAADLPPISLVDRLSLIAVQFDLTFKIAAGGTRLDLTPLPDDLPKPAEARPPTSTRRSQSKSPSAGSSANIEAIRIQRLSVQAEPLGPVLRQLCERLGLELRIDETAVKEAGISLDQRVTVKVENATIDDLFRELLKSTGLRFRRHQKIVEIVPER